LEKKDIERFFLTKFLDETNLSSQVENISDLEEPDFVLTFPDKIVGVELTSLYHDIKLKEERVAVDKIIENAKKYFEKTSDLCLAVFITFRKPLILKGTETSNFGIELAENIAQIIETHGVNDEFEISIDRWFQSDRTDLLPWIERIRIDRKKAMPFSIWQHSRGYMAGTLQQDFFQNKLTKKELKLDKYKINAKTQYIWLLFIIEGKEYSDYSYINEVTQSHWCTNFDRIYLFEVWGDQKVSKLKCYT
jgi:hypothetical protein